MELSEGGHPAGKWSTAAGSHSEDILPTPQKLFFAS